MITSLSQLFAHVEATRPRRCGVCGGGIPWPSMAHCFAHRLSKGPWKALALEPWNIEFVCSVACHHAVDARRTVEGPAAILADIARRAAAEGRSLPRMKCGNPDLGKSP